MPKKVLITGGSGFIATNLIEYLRKGHYDIHVFSRTPEFINSKYPELKLYGHSAFYAEGLIKAINPDWVFHTAAYGIQSTQTNENQLPIVNYIQTKSLVDCCSKLNNLESFINIGSCLEYGKYDGYLSETSSAKPDSEYGISKLAGTNYCYYMANKCRMNLVTVRPFHVYGPHENQNRLIPKLINLGFKNELPPLVEKESVKDFVYVEDLVETMISISQNQDKFLMGEYVNICSGIPNTLAHLVYTVIDKMSITAVPQWGTGPKRPWDNELNKAGIGYIGSDRRLRHSGCSRVVHTLSQGLDRTIAWWKENQHLVA